MSIDKFRFSVGKMLSNTDGKPSSSGVMGALVVFTGCIAFIFGTFDFIWGTNKPDIMIYSTALIGTGSTLLGFRKSKDATIPTEGNGEALHS